MLVYLDSSYPRRDDLDKTVMHTICTTQDMVCTYGCTHNILCRTSCTPWATVKDLNKTDYLFHFLICNKDNISRMGSRSTVNGIRLEDLKKIKFLSPTTQTKENRKNRLYKNINLPQNSTLTIPITAINAIKCYY